MYKLDDMMSLATVTGEVSNGSIEVDIGPRRCQDRPPMMPARKERSLCSKSSETFGRRDGVGSCSSNVEAAIDTPNLHPSAILLYSTCAVIAHCN